MRITILSCGMSNDCACAAAAYQVEAHKVTGYITAEYQGALDRIRIIRIELHHSYDARTQRWKTSDDLVGMIDITGGAVTIRIHIPGLYNTPLRHVLLHELGHLIYQDKSCYRHLLAQSYGDYNQGIIIDEDLYSPTDDMAEEYIVEGFAADMAMRI